MRQRVVFHLCDNQGDPFKGENAEYGSLLEALQAGVKLRKRVPRQRIWVVTPEHSRILLVLSQHQIEHLIRASEYLSLYSPYHWFD